MEAQVEKITGMFNEGLEELKKKQEEYSNWHEKMH